MKNLLVIVFFVLVTINISSQERITVSETNTSSILEVQSTTKGVLLPRMSKNLMNAIDSPAQGLLVYCLTCNRKGIYVFNGSSFIPVNRTREIVSTFKIIEFPENNKIYKRDKNTNKASINVECIVNPSYNITSVSLDIYKDSNHIYNLTKTLPSINIDGYYEFSFNTLINAELSSYTYVLSTNTGEVLAQADNITAGDIFIISGQSNTFGDSPDEENDYLRTFTASLGFQSSKLGINLGIGAIATQVADKVVTDKNIPVLFFNGGEGGKSISYFQRNEYDKYSTANNYGVLLKRFEDAGYLPSDVTAFIWFQGESDANTTSSSYTNSFDNLYNAWEEDYNPDRYYLIQVKGCGVTVDSEIQEVQRKFGLNYAKITSISTNGIVPGSDNCHYGPIGYPAIGDNLYSVLDKECYDGSDSNIYSPNVTNVKFGNVAKTMITFNLYPNTDTFTIGNADIRDSFYIENSTVAITNVSIIGSLVTLSLSGSVTQSNPKLSFFGDALSDTKHIFNQNNIGMFSFKNINIEDF